MNKQEIEDYIESLKQEKKVRVYTPYKYFKGLKTKQEIQSRLNDIIIGSKSDDKDNASYRTFDTDKNKKTKESKYTLAFRKKYGENLHSLQDKSRASGVPLPIIEKVFNKGKAAWRTGHRVGANAEQWGYARVHSFLTLGCTAFSADFSLLKQAVEQMSQPHLQQLFCQPILCPESTLEKAYYKKIGAKEIILQWINTYCHSKTIIKKLS